MLPFSLESYFQLVGEYNRAVWPGPVLALLLGALAFALAVRPARRSGRAAACVLALAWIWVGGVFHLAYFSLLNFAAPLYGALFLLQGLVLIGAGVIQDRFARVLPLPAPDPWARAGVAVMIAGLLAYPLADGLAGHGWANVRIFGLAPEPTILVTCGYFLKAGAPPPVFLVVIPLVASLVTGFSAWVLGLPWDAVVPLAAAAALIRSFRPGRTLR